MRTPGLEWRSNFDTFQSQPFSNIKGKVIDASVKVRGEKYLLRRMVEDGSRSAQPLER